MELARKEQAENARKAMYEDKKDENSKENDNSARLNTRSPSLRLQPNNIVLAPRAQNAPDIPADAVDPVNIDISGSHLHEDEMSESAPIPSELSEPSPAQASPQNRRSF